MATGFLMVGVKSLTRPGLNSLNIEADCHGDIKLLTMTFWAQPAAPIRWGISSA